MPKMTRQDQHKWKKKKLNYPTNNNNDDDDDDDNNNNLSSVHTMLGSTIRLTLVYHVYRGGSRSLFDTYYITFVLLNHLYLILSKYLPKFLI